MEPDIFFIVRNLKEQDYFDFIKSKQININLLKNKYNLLQSAISRGKTNIGIDLIKKGINLNYQDKDGLTSLHYAATYNNFEIAKAIIENGGSINVKDKYGNNPLWYATFNSNGKYYDLVKLLVENGGDYYSKNEVEKSPLDMAMQYNDNNLLHLFNK